VDQLSIRSARQVEVARKHVSGIIPAALVVAVMRVSVALVVAAFITPWIVIDVLVPERRRTRRASNLDPIIFTIAAVIVSVARVKIVEHGLTPEADVASERGPPRRIN